MGSHTWCEVGFRVVRQSLISPASPGRHFAGSWGRTSSNFSCLLEGDSNFSLVESQCQSQPEPHGEFQANLIDTVRPCLRTPTAATEPALCGECTHNSNRDRRTGERSRPSFKPVWVMQQDFVSKSTDVQAAEMAQR